jgi:hypothetical protein
MTGRVDERSGEQLSSNYGGMDFFIRVYAGKYALQEG